MNLDITIPSFTLTQWLLLAIAAVVVMAWMSITYALGRVADNIELHGVVVRGALNRHAEALTNAASTHAETTKVQYASCN